MACPTALQELLVQQPLADAQFEIGARCRVRFEFSFDNQLFWDRETWRFGFRPSNADDRMGATAIQVIQEALRGHGIYPTMSAPGTNPKIETISLVRMNVGSGMRDSRLSPADGA
jgi:hypothetical protein